MQPRESNQKAFADKPPRDITGWYLVQWPDYYCEEGYSFLKIRLGFYPMVLIKEHKPASGMFPASQAGADAGVL
jgi:hypothetical protein